MHTIQHSLSVLQEDFPPDEKKVKFKHHQTDEQGNVIAPNENTPECYENAEVIEIPRNDFDFLMQVFEKYETDKTKRADCQKRYFQKNKKEYYERQKKWRDGHKVDLNARRRNKYWLDKTAAAITDIAGNSMTTDCHDVLPSSESVLPEASVAKVSSPLAVPPYTASPSPLEVPPPPEDPSPLEVPPPPEDPSPLAVQHVEFEEFQSAEPCAVLPSELQFAPDPDDAQCQP